MTHADTAPVVAIADYGIGNLRSAEKALQRVGADASLETDPARIAAADGVVLPGVGAFGRCRSALAESGLEGVVLDAAQAALAGTGAPFLGICVGMQLLFDGSDESPDAAGLGIVPGHVRLLPHMVKRPQMQWNRLDVARPDHPLFSELRGEAWMYFVHSYAARADETTAPSVVATCDYGGPQVAAVGSGRLAATQFHPEKSSTDGMALLRGFVRECAAARTASPAAR